MRRAFKVVRPITVRHDVVTYPYPAGKLRSEDIALVQEEHEIRLFEKWVLDY